MITQQKSQRRLRKSYLDAREKIHALLSGTEFNPGDQIPAERELTELIGVSRATLRKLITELIDQGILERRGNQGTWLKNIIFERPLIQPTIQGISQIATINGASAGSRLLYFQQIPASQGMARILHIPLSAPVIMLKRLRMADGVPFCIETSYLPAERVPGLTAEMLEQHGSLYRLLTGHYGVSIAADEGTIRAGKMNDEELSLLQAPPDSPALIYKGVISDSAGVPLEYLVSVNHPDKVAFRIHQPLADINA